MVAMAATGFALHAHAHLLPQRPAHSCQTTAGRVPSTKWGCATIGRDAHRIAQRDSFQVYASAVLDLDALEAQVKGEHLVLIFLPCCMRCMY